MSTRYAVEWRVSSGRGPVNRYDFAGRGAEEDHARKFMAKVLARAKHVTGRDFVAKMVLMPQAQAMGEKS
jgi:hypothetical protein